MKTRRPVYVQYPLTATAVALSTLGELAHETETPISITVKNASGAAASCYLGANNVTAAPANAGIELGAGQSYTFDEHSPAVIYIVGTPGANAYIVAEYA